MESNVLITLYPTKPGNPKTSPQNNGAITPSELFSAKLSKDARAMALSSKAVEFRPMINETARRAWSVCPAAKGSAIACT